MTTYVHKDTVDLDDWVYYLEDEKLRVVRYGWIDNLLISIDREMHGNKGVEIYLAWNPD